MPETHSDGEIGEMRPRDPNSQILLELLLRQAVTQQSVLKEHQTVREELTPVTLRQRELEYQPGPCRGLKEGYSVDGDRDIEPPLPTDFPSSGSLLNPGSRNST